MYKVKKLFKTTYKAYKKYYKNKKIAAIHAAKNIIFTSFLTFIKAFYAKSFLVSSIIISTLLY